MNCGHECFKIGGPWIDVDPNCPFHGYEAQANEKCANSHREEIYEMIENAEDLGDIKIILRELLEMI